MPTTLISFCRNRKIHLKIHMESLAITTVWCWHKDRHINQWNRIEQWSDTRDEFHKKHFFHGMRGDTVQAVMWAMGSGRWSFVHLPAAHLLLCSPVPNKPWLVLVHSLGVRDPYVNRTPPFWISILCTKHFHMHFSHVEKLPGHEGGRIWWSNGNIHLLWIHWTEKMLQLREIEWPPPKSCTH